MVSKQEQAPRDSTDVAPKDASTVILIRDAAADVAAPGIEVFLLRRVKGMAFAGGMTVFPGGGVDPSDADAEVDWAGPSVDWWASRFSTDPARAKALVCAAVRETFEECGVLLAGPSADTVVADTSRYAQSRTQLEKRELSFSDFLKRENLVLRADLLRPWANWITPPGRTRRYDTFFFAAALPPGQQAEMLTTEADLGQWRSPQELLGEGADGTTALMPPTVAMLTDLAGYASIAQVLAAQRVVTPVRVRAGDFPGVG
jgi:8-oxo-dGTP pyrophosphatase MutT (NUDIX family)